MKRVKRGQIEMSFGMIFSIILIVVFLAVAFYAIKTFLRIQDSAEVGVFTAEIQEDVERLWKSTESSQDLEYILSSDIKKVCFIDFKSGARGDLSNLYSELKFYDFGERNVLFYPVGSSETEGFELKKIDIAEITVNENPFCIESEGKLKLNLEKGFGEALVSVNRIETN